MIGRFTWRPAAPACLLCGLMSLAIVASHGAAEDDVVALAELPAFEATAEIPEPALRDASVPDVDPPAAAEIPDGDSIATRSSTSVLIVVGAAGLPEYGRRFAEWAGRWREAAQLAGASVTVMDSQPESERPAGTPSDHDRLRDELRRHAEAAPGELWIVLIGHGTFDGRTARFNLVGADVSETELAEWLAPVTCPVAVINTSSSSGPFLERLSKENRIVITATRSGAEQNVARFGDFLSRAIVDLKADLDEDGQTSLLEAWLAAARWTAESYAAEGRLATEHSQLDDDGDGYATRPEAYRGIRPASGGFDLIEPDGRRAHQFHLVKSDAESRFPSEARQRRDAIELELTGLRGRKAELGDEEYYRQLETKCLELARLYDRYAPLQTAGGDEAAK